MFLLFTCATVCVYLVCVPYPSQVQVLVPSNVAQVDGQSSGWCSKTL